MPPLLPFLQTRLPFPVPTADVQAGLPLVNGTLGALLCGDGRTLRITLNRADYGYHREGDELPEPLPLGRLDLELPSDWLAASGGLHLLTGEAELELDAHREQGKARATMLRDRPVLCVRITGPVGAAVHVRNRPPDAPEVLEHFQELGLPAAQTFDLDEFGGWVQERPGARATCVGWLRHDLSSGFVFYATAVYGETPQEAKKAALQTLSEVRAEGYTSATLRSFGGWRKWWGQLSAADQPVSLDELIRCLDLYRHGGIDLPGESTGIPGPAGWLERIGMEAAPDGELVLAYEGREIARGPLRPEWLDGPAIRGHRPPTKAYRP